MRITYCSLQTWVVTYWNHANTNLCCPFPFSPEGSYTDDTSQEHHTPHRRPGPPQPGNPNPDPHEFDDEFDDDDPLPVIGHCKALYSFDGEDKRHEMLKNVWKVWGLYKETNGKELVHGKWEDTIRIQPSYKKSLKVVFLGCNSWNSPLLDSSRFKNVVNS